MSSVVISGDVSGSVTLQAPSAAGTTTLTLPATSGTVLTSTSATVGSGGITFSDGSTQTAAASPYVLKNRIINGDMRIDQRNAGASVTPTIGVSTYTLDRFFVYVPQSSKLTVQQNAGSVTPPTGFTKYLGITSSSSYAVLSTDQFVLGQGIEGFNCADLAWGTANAKTVTLSFQVYSSLTGTFGGSIQNAAQTRSYIFTYTISSANTWTTISITIPGDTSGTWLTNNSAGMYVWWSLGVGSNYIGTAGSWATNGNFSVSGATSVVGTNGATFYITGVQLEIGSTATPFERRLYNQELANCQRYYEKSYDLATVPGTGATPPGYTQTFVNNGVTTASYIGCSERFKVEKRAAPTMTSYDWSGNSGKCTRATLGVGNDANQTWSFESSTTSSWIGYSSGTANRSTAVLYWTASAEL